MAAKILGYLNYDVILQPPNFARHNIHHYGIQFKFEYHFQSLARCSESDLFNLIEIIK